MSKTGLSVQLSGEDGNIFGILGRCLVIMRRSGMSQNERDTFMQEATAGDYDHALSVIAEWFEVS